MAGVCVLCDGGHQVNNYFFIFFIVFFKHGELFGATNVCTARPFKDWYDNHA